MVSPLMYFSITFAEDLLPLYSVLILFKKLSKCFFTNASIFILPKIIVKNIVFWQDRLKIILTVDYHYLCKMQTQKKDIRSLTKEQLQDFFVSKGEKAFRGKQVY